MFDVAPSELLVVALVALVVIGPKQLPAILLQLGRWVGKARDVANHFRAGLDEMVRDVEREDADKAFREAQEAKARSEALLAERKAQQQAAAAPLLAEKPLAPAAEASEA
jgi:sec-independent protein translocase protein TatB